MISYEPGWRLPDHPVIRQMERFGELPEAAGEDPGYDEDEIYEERRDGAFDD